MQWSSKRRGLVVAGLLAAAFLAVVGVYPSLPDRMVTHWGATGDPNGWTSRFWGAFFGPLLATLLAPFLWYLPRIDPRERASEGFRPAYERFVVGFVAFLLYVHAFVLLANLGVDVPLTRAVAPAMSALYYGVGLLVERAEPNWFVGVRTPWTLDDATVWHDTNERSARGFKLAAVVALGGFVWPAWFLLFAVAPVLLVAADAVVYSYRRYRRLAE